jgi:hypothetical protein
MIEKHIKDCSIEVVMQRPVAQDVRQVFFSEKNHTILETTLIQDYSERYQLSLDEKERKRLSNTVQHYCGEVYKKQGNKPIQQLNREVLVATSKDFLQYIERKESTRGKVAVKQVMDEQLFQETSQRFERVNQERNEVKALPPAIPDFRISLKEDGPPAAEIFELAKKQREMEMLKAEQGIQQRAQSDMQFRAHQSAQNKGTELVLRNQVIQPPSTHDAPLVVMPDRRELLMGNIGSFDGLSGTQTYDQGRLLGQANGDPTISEPQLMLPGKILPQHTLIPQEPVISYREVENNLIIYSADRDWLRNNKENRYNFTVNFDPAANGQSFGPTLASQQKFKNIVRIELVKCIMAGESLSVTVQRTLNNPCDTSFMDTILNLPYVAIRVAELENNNYGTDNFLDRSFGVLQYDAQWQSDVSTSNTISRYDSRGYFAMIPKFMKCQKEYYPTPLSTLQKMTIDIRRPNGELLSTTPDTFDIGGIIAPQPMLDGTTSSNVVGTIFPFTNVINNATLNPLKYNVVAPMINGTAANFFINTTKYFSRYDVSIGDRIQISGYNYPEGVLNDPTYGQCLRAFCSWINRPEGHIVLNVAYTGAVTGGNSALTDGPNEIGYANFIIIQAPYHDPTTGNIQLMPFGPMINGAIPNIGAILNSFGGALLTPMRLINLNRQLNVVFRIITRDMDSLPSLRPNNAF